MKTVKPEMGKPGKDRRAIAKKRSNGEQAGRKKFLFSSRRAASPKISSSKVVGKKQRLQSRILHLERTETEVAKMKIETRDITESVMAAKKAAENTEAEFATLIAGRNELKRNLIKKKNKLLKMKAIEAFVMPELGSL